MRLAGARGSSMSGHFPAAVELLELLNAAGTAVRAVKLPAGTALFSGPEEAEALFVLRDGELSLFVEEREILNFEPGDVLSPGMAIGGRGAIIGSFGTRLDRIELAAIEFAVAGDPQIAVAWRCFTQETLARMAGIVADLSRGERAVAPDLRKFKDGEIIIEQGCTSDQVFTLLNGSAEVLVDGVKIGEVLEDEIFGAIGALCRIARTATVRSCGPCEVLTLPGDRFAELLSLRPDTVVKLVQDLANAVTRMNQQLIEIKRQNCSTTVAAADRTAKSFT